MEMEMAAVDPRFTKFFETTKSEAEAQRERQSYAENEKLKSTLPCEGGGLMHCYRGVWLHHTHLHGVLSSTKHFVASPTDIFLNTYPKCGTTWIKALASAVLNRRRMSCTSVKDGNGNGSHPLLSVHPQDCHFMLESLFSYPELPNLTIMPQPRTFSTHLPYSLLPDSVKGDDDDNGSSCGSHIVYVSRDPKDALVSLWYFVNENNIVAAGHGANQTHAFSLEKLYCDFVAGTTAFGPIWDHQMEYRRESMRRPEKVLYLVYEEMKAKPEENVRKLAAFLGQPFTAEEEKAGTVEEVVELCSLEFLKKKWTNDKGTAGRKWKYSSFFRKGAVGDWKNHLTPEMADRIDHITQQKLSEFGLN